MDLPVSTLRTILANRNKIECSAVTGNCKRQKIKHGNYDELEKILLEWFNQTRSFNLPTNGNIIIKKAHKIAKRLNIDKFTGSNGWVDRFKKRHGIVYRQFYGVADSVNDANSAAWSENILPNLLKEYSLDDVFNADEFGLFFKLMPDKSLVFKHEHCQGGNLSKERLSVLACTNATGSQKLRLLVIGKYKSPRCFKNIRKFPCDYVSQNHAWMTAWNEITADVIKNCFRKAKFVEVEDCDDNVLKEINHDSQGLEAFPGYVEIDDDIATSIPRSIDQIITDNISSADVSTIKEESEKEEENDTTQILPVTNALDYVHELRRLIASFDNADETLQNLNKVENFLLLKK
ncbi:tigger transposable element-derived protein 6-like [Melanaphis sacchari]|uniref:tigger transposable element-derived protein 6-like n=1 Tax=Melanaphis sacchari TaxID=742174 RepID=UPI000DC147A5|nr:tigger transposable element-derived protein 6-like [Melanaphis sacchari]